MRAERIEYIVACNGREWIVTSMGCILGTHACEGDAMRRAIEAARDAGVKGHQAEVLVRERGNTLRSAWTFGLDPFPAPSVAK